MPSSAAGVSRRSIRHERELGAGRFARVKVPRIRMRRRAAPRRGLRARLWWSTRTRPRAATRGLPAAGAHLSDGAHRITRGSPERKLEVCPKPTHREPRTRDECAPVEVKGCDGHQYAGHRSGGRRARPELPVTCCKRLTNPAPPRRRGVSPAASLPRCARPVTRRNGASIGPQAVVRVRLNGRPRPGANPAARSRGDGG